jgi:O-antigen/teichoic acid export membrane protein
MDQGTQLKRNSILSFFSAFVRLSANTLMFIGIARFYGPTTFGSFSTAHIFSFIFIMIADFGFDLLLTTEVARNKEKAHEFVRKYFSIKLLFALITVGIIWLIPSIHPTSKTTAHLFYILSFSVLYTSLTNFFFALFKGLEQFQHEIKITIIINLLLLFSLIILGILKVQITIIATLFVITRAIGLLLASIKTTKLISTNSFTLTLSGWSDDWKNILIFGFSLIFGNLYFQLITPMLAFIKGDYEVGIFESVFKITGLALILVDIIFSAALPTLTRLHEVDKTKWIYMSKLLNKTLLMIALPISLFFYIYPEQVIEFLYGKEKFTDAVAVMRIASLLIIARYIGETFALMLTTSKRQHLRMVVTIFGTATTAGLSLLLIPQYGAYGAAIVALIVNLLVGIGYILWNIRYARTWILEKEFLVPLIFILTAAWLNHCINIEFARYSLPVILPLYIIVAYYFGYNSYERKLIFSFKDNIFKSHE